jgi:purine-binding chemotaxis protein CheW
MQTHRRTSGKRQRSDPQKSLVGFFVGDVHYAVDIASVMQILNPLPITVLPHLGGVVAGVAEIRGEVIPVLDLRARFGLPAAVSSRRNKWVLVDAGGRTAALAVDSVSDVFARSSVEARGTPSLGRGDEARGIVGVFDVAGKLTFLLAPSQFRMILDALDTPALSGSVAVEAPIASRKLT